jgi:hypothetical protein
VNWSEETYDLAIAAIGYEQRARAIFESHALEIRARAACGFKRQEVLEYDRNLSWYRSADFAIASADDGDYPSWLEETLEVIRTAQERTKILVDISSLTRIRIANLISAFLGIRSDQQVDAFFVYSLAAFTSPITDQPPNTHVGPVTPDFAGWWSEPDRALSAVVGLGYEQDKALGAVEHLQADSIWLFRPESKISEYSVALEEANDTLLRAISSDRQFTYKVQDPLGCFVRLESLVQGLSKESNVVLLPFGPKIFALCSLLVGAMDRQVAVWRVSAQENEEPVNRMGSGYCYGLKVTFRPTP